MGEILRILMLEDVPSDAELIEIEMRQAGIRFTALRVETEPEFRRALVDFQPDLILADYSLPSFNALEALRILNQQSLVVPFLLVTGSQSEEIVAQVMKEGAEDFLLKSSLMRLPSAARNALERRMAQQAKIQAEEALRQSEERLQRAINATQDGIWEWDIQTNQEFVSPRWCEILGYSFDDPELPHTYEVWASRIHPDDYDRVIEVEKSHLEKGSKYDVDYRHRHKSGEYRWQNSRGQAVLDEQGKPIKMVGCISDITERKQLEQTMEKARAEFLFAVSHELKTPLLVMGTAQQMIESLPEERQSIQFRDYSDIWRRNMMRLRFIIENLVDSQRPAGMGLKLERRPANLMELAREIVDELEPIASTRSVQLRIQGGSLPLAAVDRNAIQRLLENLLINAIKFSRPGSQVEIRLRTEGGMICLEVCDFGMGIDPQVRPFLFQPFYRSPEALKAGVQGTGLGLYVSKMIAAAHGGSIQLESELGKGTTVTVLLPIQAPAS